MANVDGNWNIAVKTPMGPQKGVLTVNSSGDGFSGRLSGDLGGMDIDNGSVAGDTLTWKMKLTKPMPLEVTCTATVSGDSLSGRVDTGAFGAFDLSGTRA